MLLQNKVAPKSVCDVGCGVGEVLRQLQENLDRECICWGYDISPQAIELAETRASERIHFERADFGQETDKFFDLILVLDVIEHLPDYFSFLQKIKEGQWPTARTERWSVDSGERKSAREVPPDRPS